MAVLVFLLICLIPLRLEYSRIRKTAWFLASRRRHKKYKICIHGARQMVHGENHNFLKINCGFLLAIWVKLVCSIIRLYSSTFTACFYHFLFWIYSNSRTTSFLPDILLQFPNSNDLNSRVSVELLCVC